MTVSSHNTQQANNFITGQQQQQQQNNNNNNNNKAHKHTAQAQAQAQVISCCELSCLLSMCPLLS
jgi:hypothetical protein